MLGVMLKAGLLQCQNLRSSILPRANAGTVFAALRNLCRIGYASASWERCRVEGRSHSVVVAREE
jgi:hypothetical protein